MAKDADRREARQQRSKAWRSQSPYQSPLESRRTFRREGD